MCIFIMKKLILTTATVLAGLAIAGCADNTVASTTAGKISQDELYENNCRFFYFTTIDY